MCQDPVVCYLYGPYVGRKYSWAWAKPTESPAYAELWPAGWPVTVPI